MVRHEVPERYRWKLTDLYETDAAWEVDFTRLKDEIPGIAALAGTLGSAAGLLHALCAIEAEEELATKLFAYARMRRDEDNANPLYQGMTERAMGVLTAAGAAVSFLYPELVALGAETVNGFMEKQSELRIYAQFFDDVFRAAAHTLSPREEALLAMAGQVLDSASDIYDMYNNADIRFAEVPDEDGKMIRLTHGRYSRLLESRKRTVRESAFRAMYQPYQEHKNTMAATLSANVKKNCFYAKARGYSSALNLCLDAGNIPESVYHSLIDAVDAALPALGEYLKLRQRALGVERLHLFDLYTPIVQTADVSYSFEEACALVREAVKPLGEQYVKDLDAAFASGWIDVMETEGKTPGAYSWGDHSTHPFVLLNFHGTLDDVFTLAHEMGHAMHSFYTNRTQPSVYKEYKIFVAEVASTVNEALLMAHLLRITTDSTLRAYLLNQKLEGCRTTVYRQTMFAAFEREIHAAYERGEALTAERLEELYLGLNTQYFAPHVEIDPEISMEWARIPHFYSDFYVYQYATGYSAAQVLSQRILSGEGTEAYLKFLSSGSSDYPLALLRDAGVDLTTPDPVAQTLTGFSHTVSELSSLLS